jgi:hypothetical protein
MGRNEVRFRSRYYAQFLALLEKFGLPKCCRISRTYSLYQNAKHLAAALAAKLVGLIRVG